MIFVNIAVALPDIVGSCDSNLSEDAMTRRDGGKTEDSNAVVSRALADLLAEIERTEVPRSVTDLALRLSRLIAERADQQK